MADIKHLAADGASAQLQQSWGPFASGLTEVRSSKLKFAIENISNRKLGSSPFANISLVIVQVGVNDGYTYYYTAADNTGTISKVWGATADGSPLVTIGSGGAGGVWGSTGTKGVRIVSKNATGKAIGSTEATFTIDDTTKKATYNWVQTPGATGYEVHRTDTPGTYGASTLRATIGSGATVTYLDDGAATGAGAIQADNTTGGAGPTYGTAPVDGNFAQTNIVIATDPTGLSIGQQWFYWAQIRVPAATSEVGNRRTLKVTPTEA